MIVEVQVPEPLLGIFCDDVSSGSEEDIVLVTPDQIIVVREKQQINILIGRARYHWCTRWAYGKTPTTHKN